MFVNPHRCPNLICKYTLCLLLPVAAGEWSSAVAQMVPLISVFALSGGDQFSCLIPHPIAVGSTSTGSVLVGCRIAFGDV